MRVSDQQHPQPYGQPRHQSPQYAAPAPGAPQQPPQGYASVRRRGPHRAPTWLVAVVATGLLHLVMVLVLTSGGSVAGDSPLGGVLAVTATLLGIAYLGGGLLTLINLIRGWSVAGRGEVAEPWLAIRFLRAPRG